MNLWAYSMQVLSFLFFSYAKITQNYAKQKEQKSYVRRRKKVTRPLHLDSWFRVHKDREFSGQFQG
jgi:hypothetical protein